MKEFNWKNHIGVNPHVCHGRPCIRGTRIWVSLVLDLMANGNTMDDILYEYPQLTREDIQACIAYGAGNNIGFPKSAKPIDHCSPSY
jgi:uncharacterized protein (DUF433 family)